MIDCVDTSGPMGGFNEACAKGFCLALMRIALADNRRCFISLFSTGQVDYELTADSGLEQSISFLGQRFRGGTDLAACLTALTEKLADPAWQDADAVVISDFIAQACPKRSSDAYANSSANASSAFTPSRYRRWEDPVS